jgi:hypothetical protein
MAAATNDTYNEKWLPFGCQKLAKGGERGRRNRVFPGRIARFINNLEFEPKLQNLYASVRFPTRASKFFTKLEVCSSSEMT